MAFNSPIQIALLSPLTPPYQPSFGPLNPKHFGWRSPILIVLLRAPWDCPVCSRTETVPYTLRTKEPSSTSRGRPYTDWLSLDRRRRHVLSFSTLEDYTVGSGWLPTDCLWTKSVKTQNEIRLVRHNLSLPGRPSFCQGIQDCLCV